MHFRRALALATTVATAAQAAAPCGAGTVEVGGTCLGKLDASVCGPGTMLNTDIGKCVAGSDAKSEIVTEDGSIMFRARTGKVGITTEDGHTQFIETAGSALTAMTEAFNLGYSLTRDINHTRALLDIKDEVRAVVEASTKVRSELSKDLEAKQGAASAELKTSIDGFTKAFADLRGKLSTDIDAKFETLSALSKSYDKLEECYKADKIFDKDGKCVPRPPAMPTEKQLKSCTKDGLGLMRYNTARGFHEACGKGKKGGKEFFGFYPISLGGLKGLGEEEDQPGASCSAIFKDGQTASKMYFVKKVGGVYKTYCDMTKKGADLGGSGTETSPGLDCKALRAEPHSKTTSAVYYITAGDNHPPHRTYCDMTTDGGGWTMMWAHAFGGISGFCGSSCAQKWRTFSTVNKACDVGITTNSWCNFVPKKTNPTGATELAWASYHKGTVVYFYKARYNKRFGVNVYGTTIHDHSPKMVVDRCRSSRGVPPDISLNGIPGLQFDKTSPGRYRSNCDTSRSSYRGDCRWENCSPPTGTHNQMTTIFWVR